MRGKRASKHNLPYQPPSCKARRFFVFTPVFSPFPPYEDDNMSRKAPRQRCLVPQRRETSQTDDERIKDITVLPLQSI